MQGLMHKPTEETRKLVRTLSSVGITYDDISNKLNITAETLRKHYKEDLLNGRVDANALIGQSLYQSARDGNTSAQMFWLKTRAGWKETNALELSGADGGAIQVITGIDDSED
jgi:predicted ArsR family transcriptional regulator